MIEAMKHYEAALLKAFPKGAFGDVFEHWNKARQAIAEAEKQEPVAYRYWNEHNKCFFFCDSPNPVDGSVYEPLYTQPQPRKQELLFEVDGEMLTLNQIAGVELFNFQEATGCNTAEEFKAKQEPVAWMMLNSSGDEISITESNLRHRQPAFVQNLWKNSTPLYTHPQQRKPLTDEQIWEIAKDLEAPSWRQIVKTIEKAHGIKE